MKIQKIIGGATALTVVLTGGLFVAAQSQEPQSQAKPMKGLSFHDGRYFFHARSEANGLFRDVMVHNWQEVAKNSKPSTTVIFAKYARKDANGNQWVLGSAKGVIYDGNRITGETTAKRLLLKLN